MPSKSIFGMTWPMTENTLTHNCPVPEENAAFVFQNKITNSPEKQLNYTLTLFKTSSHQ